MNRKYLWSKKRYPLFDREGIWLQWALADTHCCFVIVSAIKPNDEAAILPDVEKMVQLFKVVNEGGG